MLVFDCETHLTFSQAGFEDGATLFHRSRDEKAFEMLVALSRMRVTVCVVLENDHSTAYVPPEHESSEEFPIPETVGELEVSRNVEELISRLTDAPAICAWNGAFDIAVLAKYIPQQRRHLTCTNWSSKLIDPMVYLSRVTKGSYLKLADVCRLNMDEAESDSNQTKECDGIQAVRWYESGEWIPLIEYCHKDVLLTHRLLTKETLLVPVPLRLEAGLEKRTTSDASVQTPIWMRKN